MACRKGVSSQGVLWTMWSMLLLASGFLPAAAAQSPPAEYSDVEFTPVITDANDYPGAGFLDLLEIAIGMTWDETLNASLVFRITVEDWADDGPFDEGRLRVFFDLAGSSWQGAVTSAGTPAGGSLGSATVFAFDRCEVVENSAFCVVPYATFEFVPPATMTSSNAYSCLISPTGHGAAQDRAPGGLATDAALEAIGMPIEWGGDYEVTNVTRPSSATEAPAANDTHPDATDQDLAAAPSDERAPGPPGIFVAVAVATACRWRFGRGLGGQKAGHDEPRGATGTDGVGFGWPDEPGRENHLGVGDRSRAWTRGRIR